MQQSIQGVKRFSLVSSRLNLMFLFTAFNSSLGLVLNLNQWVVPERNSGLSSLHLHVDVGHYLRHMWYGAAMALSAKIPVVLEIGGVRQSSSRSPVWSGVGFVLLMSVLFCKRLLFIIYVAFLDFTLKRQKPQYQHRPVLLWFLPPPETTSWQSSKPYKTKHKW